MNTKTFFSDRNYRVALRWSIAIIYLIIIAGAVVRMTGSGMGCPDWPKCFGYYIPPTETSELEFSPDTPYKKGMVIIHDEELRVAKKDFFTTTSYQEADWNAYTKHDYAVFNVYHTWTEYVNRLIGALGGLVVLIMCVFSLKYWKKRKKITILSIVALLAMLIQAVIGKIVVDTNLSPALITIHMIVALLIVGLLIYLLHEVQPVDNRYEAQSSFYNLAVILIVLTLIQVALGTQVRQYLDHQIDELGYPFLSIWLEENAPLVFLVHRSFSILLLGLHGWFVYKAIKFLGHPRRYYGWLMALLLLTIFTGVLMNYVDFPFGSQAAHLVLASIILGVQFYLMMRLRKAISS
ncbi:MAG: COX15/CtaA family protein [Nonlabens sp.]|uniref:COX15/CtaA family protein n=1 Tax=Nonlabens sp. TaxID=1888209 RepID=UPI003EF3474D